MLAVWRRAGDEGALVKFSEGLHPGVKRARAYDSENTLAPALALVRRHRFTGVMLVGLCAAGALHAAMGTVLASVARGASAAPPEQTVEIQLDSPPPAPMAKPPPPPPPPPPAPEVATAASEPAPAAAQAGKVLTQDPRPTSRST